MALEHHLKGFHINSTLKKNVPLSLILIADTYLKMGQYLKALEYYESLQASCLSSQNGRLNLKYLHHSYAQMAIIHKEYLNDQVRSIECLKIALLLSIDLGEKGDFVRHQQNLASYFADLKKTLKNEFFDHNILTLPGDTASNYYLPKTPRKLIPKKFDSGLNQIKIKLKEKVLPMIH